MKSFRQSSIRSVFVLLALTSLLLQAQAAFACQMMEAAGPAQDCCCVEKLHRNDPAVCDEAAAQSCCKFSVEVYPHSLDAGWAPLWGSLPFDRNPAHMGIVHRPVDGAQTHSGLPELYRLDPASPGTQTYLATLRLRI